MSENQGFSLPIQPTLSLLTLPFLGGLFLADTITNSSIEIGKLSEELFRGDRLPALPFPEPSTTPENA